MIPSERMTFVIPGDDPVQIQGSPHLERLKPYGDVVLYTDRPSTHEEKLERVKDADVIINTRSMVKWPGEGRRVAPEASSGPHAAKHTPAPAWPVVLSGCHLDPDDDASA